MAITGSAHDGLVTYSLESALLTLVGPGGTFKVEVGDYLHDNGKILSFNALTRFAIVEYTAFGQTEKKEVPLGNLNPRSISQVSIDTTPVHKA